VPVCVDTDLCIAYLISICTCGDMMKTIPAAVDMLVQTGCVMARPAGTYLLCNTGRLCSCHGSTHIILPAAWGCYVLTACLLQRPAASSLPAALREAGPHPCCCCPCQLQHTLAVPQRGRVDKSTTIHSGHGTTVCSRLPE
jgi:hypothetical protein